MAILKQTCNTNNNTKTTFQTEPISQKWHLDLTFESEQFGQLFG